MITLNCTKCVTKDPCDWSLATIDTSETVDGWTRTVQTPVADLPADVAQKCAAAMAVIIGLGADWACQVADIMRDDTITPQPDDEEGNPVPPVVTRDYSVTMHLVRDGYNPKAKTIKASSNPAILAAAEALEAWVSGQHDAE